MYLVMGAGIAASWPSSLAFGLTSAIADGGTAASATSCGLNGTSCCSSGATLTTAAIAALFAPIVVSIARPLEPPPPALIACAIRAGGMLFGFLYVASLVNRAGCAC